jgi:hypothetical protein
MEEDNKVNMSNVLSIESEAIAYCFFSEDCRGKMWVQEKTWLKILKDATNVGSTWSKLHSSLLSDKAPYYPHDTFPQPGISVGIISIMLEVFWLRSYEVTIYQVILVQKEHGVAQLTTPPVCSVERKYWARQGMVGDQRHLRRILES